MENLKFPRTTQALAVYGPNLYAQSKRTGIPYTTLRDWFLYGRVPNINKLSRFPDLLSAFAEDITDHAEHLVALDPVAA